MVTFDPAHIVGTGGAIGAPLRTFVSQRVDTDEFPVGTVPVNVIGSFSVGLVTFLSLDQSLVLLLGTGACGSFTTFSSFTVETVRLWESGESLRAIANAVGKSRGRGHCAWPRAGIGVASGVAVAEFQG